MRRLAWVSSGVDTPDTASSFYTRALLPVITRSFDIEVFSEFGADGSSTPAVELGLRHLDRPFEAVVYNIEDRPECDFVRRVMGLIPGVAVYHDVLISPRSIEMSTSPDLGCHKMFRSLSYERAAEDPYFVHFELAQTLLGLFTNERNLNEFQRRWRGVRESSGFPDLVLLPAAIPQSMLGLGGEPRPRGETPRIVFAGRPRLEDRVHHVLRAVSCAGSGFSFSWMISDSELEEALSLCAEFSIPSDCLIKGRSPENWSCAIAGASLALHPYFSVFGDPGVYLPISLARGVTCVVSDFSVGSLYPDSVVIKIRPGDGEADALCGLIRRAADAEVFPQGGLGSIYAEENHDARLIGAELERVIDRSWPELERITSAWVCPSLF